MKKILFYTIALLPFCAFAQDQTSFSIKSKLGNLNTPARAYLMYQLGANRVLDSAIITNGSFNFNGKILNPVNAYLVIDHAGVGLNHLDNTADVLPFYIDKDAITITGPDSVAKATITGSKINDDNKSLLAQLEPLVKKAGDLKVKGDAASEAEKNSVAFQNDMQAKYKELQVEQKAIFKIFIIAHPDSYLSLLALNSLGGPSPDPTEIQPLYDSLSASLRETEAAKMLKKELEGLKITAVGSLAQDFTQPDVNGTPVKLSQLRGKYVLLDFWASWCGPCRQENPNVVKAYNKYKDKNFTILGVSLDKAEAKSNWLAAIKSDGLVWTQVSDLQFWNNNAARLYNITAIPANFLIDPNGKIVARDLRGDDLENKLQELLGK